jgi:hypothetical protein
MDALYVLSTALGTSLLFASVVWAILPEMPMWLVSVLFAVAFPLFFPIFIISRILAELVTRFCGLRSFPEPRTTEEEAMALAAEVYTEPGRARRGNSVTAYTAPTDDRLVGGPDWAERHHRLQAASGSEWQNRDAHKRSAAGDSTGDEPRCFARAGTLFTWNALLY